MRPAGVTDPLQESKEIMATTAPNLEESLRTPSAPSKEEAAAVVKATLPSRRTLIVATVLAAVVLGGSTTWAHQRHFEGTDDAQIDGSISNVSPRVSGTVAQVLVAENQHVKAGDVLAVIDAADLQIAVDQAKAAVAQAQAQLDAEDPSVPMAETTNRSAVTAARSDLAGSTAGLSAARKDVQQLTAQLAQAQANDRQAQLEKDRAEKLLSTGAVSQADFDARVNGAAATSAAVSAIEQSLAAARDRVLQQQAAITSVASRLDEVQSNAPRQVATRQASVAFRQAAVDLAKAQLAQAERNVAYTQILAPISGVVAKKAVAVGDHVAPGQSIVALSQTDDLYVTANYRETQLEPIHPGQPAAVHVDALDLDLRGTVESVGGATGSRMSVLPPENASGNYVKVVQRLPVRIHLDPGQEGLDRLRVGMSVEPSVTVR